MRCKLLVLLIILAAMLPSIFAAEYGDHLYCSDSEGPANTVKADVAGHIDLALTASPSSSDIEPMYDYCQKGATASLECRGDSCFAMDYYCVPLSSGRWGYNIYTFRCDSSAGFDGCRSGACYKLAASCSDDAQNGDETGIDCGGSCRICWQEPPRNSRGDCRHFCDSTYATGLASDSDYYARCNAVCNSLPSESASNTTTTTYPICTDGVRNGEETGVDCGGRCPRYCREPPPTTERGRCFSFCDRYSASDPEYFNECRAICERAFPSSAASPNCADSIKNGQETDIDCGGSCAACENGKRCLASADCRSSFCDAGTCRAVSSTVVVETEDEEATAVPVEEEEADAVPVEEEPTVVEAESEEQEEVFVEVVEEEEAGFFSRAWNRFRDVFAGDESVAGSGAAIEQETVLDISEGTCSSDSISGRDFCDISSRIRSSINSLSRRISERMDEVELRLRDLEDVTSGLVNGGIEQRVNNKFRTCRRYTVESPQQRQTTCQDFCENQNKMCLNGFIKYTYSGRGSMEGDCETNTLGQTFCGPWKTFYFRMPAHEHMDCSEEFQGEINSMVCFCCS